MATTTPTNTLGQLASEATRLAREARRLERQVADAVDVPACLPAREAAYRLEGLADLLEDSAATRQL